MKILFVAAEASPLVKVGGLADVVGSLPLALTALGHDVRVVIPRYAGMDLSHAPAVSHGEVPVPLAMDRAATISLSVTTLKNQVPVYLIYGKHHFGQVYGGKELDRFLFFSRAVLAMLNAIDWQPDIVHCHDWHAAPVIMWLKQRQHSASTVFTIHNLAYQGRFDRKFQVRSGLAADWGRSRHAPETQLSFISLGILCADLVTTVSMTYAREITTPANGEGVQHLLRYRSRDLVGILNGIDYDEYNPATDPHIPARYSATALAKRARNKTVLQQRAGLPLNPYVPLIGLVQRLDEQKGMDILLPALSPLLQKTGAQVVLLGRGREEYENALRQTAAQLHQHLAAFVAFDESLARLIYAGADMFLMPSRFEPCGLGQLIAMRYGALPVVRHTGGLADTVPEFSADLSLGNGFAFTPYTAEALIDTVTRAVAAYAKRKPWLAAMQRVMSLDFSWQASARRYDAVYRSLKRQE